MKIGIIGAMDEEIRLLKGKIQTTYQENHHGNEFKIGKIGKHDVVLIRSGIGKVNATISTVLLKQLYDVEYIINTGSAGGIAEGLKVGDIVIADSIVHHDVDVTAFGYQVGQMAGMPAEYNGDTNRRTQIPRHRRPQPRRPRHLQNFCRVQGRGRTQGPTHRHSGENRQGLRHGRIRPGDEHLAPAEETRPRGADRLPRPFQAARARRSDRVSSFPALRQGFAGVQVHVRAAQRARRHPHAAHGQGRAAGNPAALGLRAAAQGLRRGARDLDDDVHRPPAQHPAQGQGHRQARRPHRARRIAHLRHGRAVPADRHLEPARTELPAGRP